MLSHQLQPKITVNNFGTTNYNNHGNEDAFN